MGNKKMVHMIAFLLLIVGGLNWLLIGVFDWSIENVLGSNVSRIIFILVGIAALYEIATHKQNCKACTTGGSGSAPVDGAV